MRQRRRARRGLPREHPGLKCRLLMVFEKILRSSSPKAQSLLTEPCKPTSVDFEPSLDGLFASAGGFELLCCKHLPKLLIPLSPLAWAERVTYS
jgi:hypothetical protein